MTANPETTVDRIPLTHSVHYVARGLPEVPNHYGPGVLAPSEITLTYRAAPDSHRQFIGQLMIRRQEERDSGEAEATVGPRCGNNPGYRLSDGDRQAVEEFKAYLAQRATAAGGAGGVADETGQATPCSQPNPCEDGGDPCDRHEREQSHAEGDHSLCARRDCEVLRQS